MANVVKPENDRLEYKSLRIKDKDMLVGEVLKMFEKGEECKQKELNAMLNYGGGEVRFGIGEIKQPDGSTKCVVEEGIKLSDEEKEKINDAIHRTFTEFNPSCSSDRGDYKIEWKTETDKVSDKRHRFTVIINKCSAYEHRRIVFVNASRLEAYTRAGSASVRMSVETIKENLRRKIEADDTVRWTQASIDAKLIQRLRDALDKYENKMIEAAGIICVLKRYAIEIGRQKYLSYVLVEEVLNVMDRLACKLRFQQSEKEIADEIVNLGDCIYYECCVYSQQYSCNDSVLWHTTIQLFEVCFSVAHNSVKYHGEDNMFAKATAVLAKILGTVKKLKKTPLDKDSKKKIKDLHQSYEQLLGSIKDSKLDGPLQERLLQLHQLLLKRAVETDDSADFHIEEEILKLGYNC